MVQVSRRARPLALALMIGASATAAGGAAAQTAPGPAEAPDEFDKLVRSSDTLRRRDDGRIAVEEDRSFYRTSRPRSPKALGFGASPGDPYRDRPARPDLIYDEVLQTFRSPFTPDR